jgi:hypothetical protein
MIKLKRYWFSFKDVRAPNVLNLGCGVTAYNYDDAIGILSRKVFLKNVLPEINDFIENIDVSKLDVKHVLPNMHSPTERGVWFPLGYQ